MNNSEKDVIEMNQRKIKMKLNELERTRHELKRKKKTKRKLKRKHELRRTKMN